MPAPIFETTADPDTVDHLVQRVLRSLGPSQKQSFDPDLIWTVGTQDSRSLAMRLLMVKSKRRHMLTVEYVGGDADLLDRACRAFEASRSDFIKSRADLETTFHVLRVVVPADVLLSHEPSPH